MNRAVMVAFVGGMLVAGSIVLLAVRQPIITSHERPEQPSSKTGNLPAKAARDREEQTGRPVSGGAACDATKLRVEIREIMREELEDIVASRTDQHAQREEEPHLDQEAAAEAGRSLVAEARVTREWGEAEANEMRSLLPRMTLVQREMTLQEFASAVNSGQIRIITDGMPF